MSPGTRACPGATWAAPEAGKCCCITALQVQPGVFGENKTKQQNPPLFQMTFSLLYHIEKNQALNLQSCRRSMRSPLANVQNVREREIQIQMIVWFDNCHLTVFKIQNLENYVIRCSELRVNINNSV